MKQTLHFVIGLFCLAGAKAEDMPIGFGPGQSTAIEDILRKVHRSAYRAPRNTAAKPIEWLHLAGGEFVMGANRIRYNEHPAFAVNIRPFEMATTLTTVAQYRECVDQHQCSPPDAGKDCNWGKPGRDDHPINCLDWMQANAYAKFVGGRLPTEEEWEYAATSQGKSWKFPWGNAEATCERAVMYGNGGYGCGSGGTLPVCSKPAGNTEQGLCDMAGNVSHWIQDIYHDCYKNMPIDGAAYDGPGTYRVLESTGWVEYMSSSLRVIRGASWIHTMAWSFESRERRNVLAIHRHPGIGVRPARSIR